ncbi:chemotaxis response regulator protein-glutamate methylesterase [Aliifodinibius salicampi]|uniref:Protein-glutamate methylesterase/protein-glutamine glutaminase n=1 Tax=Fodinibius salicampi TaxID=1920655 RepID=A0ABT3Q0L3_9BACT|nr:chemotaxis response regulator protein-glutamate methylesterase [Fodinibius salicampi]MCW9713634.1 chemotaxis response regulator protein-glutamate methylesterase [Fodinibius salicampi]
MIKVLVVDDSALVRKLLTKELNKQKDIEVVGTALNPYIAREKIAKLKPDVLTLDLEMPRMDGLSFLSKLMKHHPMPVVVVSSLTPQNSENALEALRLGAVDVICKPGSAYSTQNISREIIQAVRAASVARFDHNVSVPAPKQVSVNINNNDSYSSQARLKETTKKIVAIGASTGGTKALEVVLPALPYNLPGIVIVQHMPPVFTKSFADRLDTICKVSVKEAEDGDWIRPGQVLIAPGNYHMLVEKKGAKYYTKIKQGPPVHHHRPSVDVMFNSVAKAAGMNATGVILTGMGADGAKGLLAMKKEGAHTIGQDEDSCVVYGMPKVAHEVGAVLETQPLSKIAEAIIARTKEKVI